MTNVMTADFIVYIALVAVAIAGFAHTRAQVARRRF